MKRNFAEEDSPNVISTKKEEANSFYINWYERFRYGSQNFLRNNVELSGHERDKS